MKRFK